MGEGKLLARKGEERSRKKGDEEDGEKEGTIDRVKETERKRERALRGTER